MKVALRALKIIIPSTFVLGAFVEWFMIKTGFYGIVTTREAERYVMHHSDEERKLKRMKELNIDVFAALDDESDDDTDSKN
jgi:hypothetical protein